MSLTVYRRAKVDAQHRISLRHAGFRPGTLVDVVAVAPQLRTGRVAAYSLFDQLQLLAGKLDRQRLANAASGQDDQLPGDYSLNFEQTFYPQRG
jgi:hypothetical protein